VDRAPRGRRRILVVDDDEPTRTMLCRFLATEGYAVDEAPDGLTALQKVDTDAPDLVLLDVMMPGQDGLDVLKGLRRTSDVPVILLTARGDEADRVLGFRFGADDYVVKPFSVGELAGRVAAVLRRAAPDPSTIELRFDGLHIDLAKREVTVNGNAVDLRPREYELLAFLASSPREVFTREQLLERVWPPSAGRGPSTVTEHIGRVRHRIEEDPERPRWIRTVRGIGYSFQP
jgi:DNA-binding response OmpR family regulator